MKPRHATLAPKVRFATTVGDVPVVEAALVRRLGARAFLSELSLQGVLLSS